MINLDDVLNKDVGVQALAGVTGLGLPEVSTQWLEGAGDGARYRGKRARPRDIDLPLYITGKTRAELVGLLDRLVIMLDGECTLRVVEDDGGDWSADVYHVAGGDFAYGIDSTGQRDLQTVVTLRAGDPYWTYSRSTSKAITNAGAGRGLIGSLASLQVSASQAIGTITLENRGTAPAFPIWTVVGPGRNFKTVSTKGESFLWTGTLAAGETLTVDTKTGTVVDQAGNNRYGELASAPRLWSIPPGMVEATASLESTTTASSITCTWRPRKRMVV